jgi:hypothetical protein
MWKFPTKPWFRFGCLTLGDGTSFMSFSKKKMTFTVVDLQKMMGKY